MKQFLYRAFLVRCWRTDDGAERFSVEGMDRQTRRGFADREVLLTYVRNLINIEPSPSTQGESPQDALPKHPTGDA